MRRKKLRAISIHSHKGGAGKTTLALALAKAWSQAGRRTCIIDLDFAGSGLEDAVRLRKPKMRVDHVLFRGKAVDVDALVGTYRDRDIKQCPIGVIINAGRPMVQNEEDVLSPPGPTRDQSVVAAGLEGMDGPILAALKDLLAGLEAQGYERCILDCHPGLIEVSLAVFEASLVQVRILVSTADAPHFWGLVKEANWYRLLARRQGRRESEKAFKQSVLVINRADPKHFETFDDLFDMATEDPRFGVEFTTVRDDLPIPRRLIVRESESLRGVQLVGPPALIPTLRAPVHADIFALRDLIDEVPAGKRTGRRRG